MKKILVTGGAGFIGSNFLHLMVKKYPNDKFVCVDALTYAGNMQTLTPIKNEKNFKFVHLNICDKDKIDLLFKTEHFDYVINFAAETHVDRSIDYPDVFVKTNVLGVQVLLDACRKYHVRRFHQISTDEVYGDLPLNSKAKFKETSMIKPSSPYSASKAAADMLVLAYNHTYKLDVTISRCSNNYGPYCFPEKLIPLMIINASNNKSLPIYGKGLNVRDWIYVYDHCLAIDIIVRKGKSGQVYNVGCNNTVNNITIAKMILKQLHKKPNLIKFVKDRPGHDLRYAIDATKIKKQLGWKPKYSFTNSLNKTITWYLNNNQWLKNISSGEYKEWMKKHY